MQAITKTYKSLTAILHSVRLTFKYIFTPTSQTVEINGYLLKLYCVVTQEKRFRIFSFQRLVLGIKEISKLFAKI